MADKSKFSIVTYQRSPGHWRAAITPFVHSGPFIRGRTTNQLCDAGRLRVGAGCYDCSRTAD